MFGYMKMQKNDEYFDKIREELFQKTISMLEFVECDTCRVKPGTPTLCRGCIANRSTINKLKKQLTNR
jgi:hypothetical protein